MKDFINPEVSVIFQDSLALHDGKVIIKIKRSMFDGKMSSILSGTVELVPGCALLHFQN